MGHDLIADTNLAFTWRGWGKSWETSTGVASLLADMHTVTFLRF